MTHLLQQLRSRGRTLRCLVAAIYLMVALAASGHRCAVAEASEAGHHAIHATASEQAGCPACIWQQTPALLSDLSLTLVLTSAAAPAFPRLKASLCPARIAKVPTRGPPAPPEANFSLFG